MRSTSFKFPRSPLALLAALVCASTPFLAHADSTYEFRQTVPTLAVTDGVTPAGALSLSTGAINFGNVATHTSETRQVLVANDGTGALSFTTNPAVTGAAFTAGATSCASSLAVSANCLAEATFAPTTVGDFSGALTFSTDLPDSPYAVALAGTAFNPVSLTAATLPAATVNTDYPPFSFSSLLAVANEATPQLGQVAWSSSGALPAGLSVTNGVLSGKPTAATSGASFQVTAAYRLNAGQQAYTIVVGNPAFATWDPLNKGSVVLSNGNLTQATGGGGWAIARATVGKPSGKWYWEVHIDSFGNDTRVSVGAALGTSSLNATHSPGYWRNYWGDADSVFVGTTTPVAYGASYTVGDTISVLLDATSHTIRFYKNCLDQGPTNYELPVGVYYPFVTAGSSAADPTITTANFGATAFRCQVPSGYNAGLF